MTLLGLLQAIAVVLAIEGLLYATMPGVMRRAIAAISAASEDRLRAGGLAAACIGVAVAWALHSA
jgi:uncharacterized protein YjeT (DUF2065 family)